MLPPNPFANVNKTKAIKNSRLALSFFICSVITFLPFNLVNIQHKTAAGRGCLIFKNRNSTVSSIQVSLFSSKNVI